MESGIKSSFIPQDATVQQTVRPVARTGFADLLILIAIVFVIASLSLAAGVFLYLRFLTSSSEVKLESLARARDAFDPALIQTLTRLDERMRAADTVLDQHIAPTVFFHLLEQLTLQTVSFSNLTFQGGDQQNMTIAMDGVAQSVNAIALQADYLSKSGMITNPLFSNIDRRVDGVHFNLTAVINPVALNFTRLLAAPAPAAQAPAEQVDDSPFGAPPPAQNQPQQ